MKTEPVVIRDSGDDPAAYHARPVPIPDGWRRVWQGTSKPGDLCLRFDIVVWSMGTKFCFVPIEPGSQVDVCALVIRNDGDQGPDKPCERCRVEVAVAGERYCRCCCELMLRKMKADRP